MAEMDHLRVYLYASAMESVDQIKKGIAEIRKNVSAKTENLSDFVKFTQAVKEA